MTTTHTAMTPRRAWLAAALIGALAVVSLAQAPRPSTGLQPLPEMTAADRYQGEDGGLYGGGRNTPPEAHQRAALGAARAIRPLNAAGQPATEGKIGLISVGMSNTTQEFSRFVQLARQDATLSPRVAIVDGAQGGMDATRWADSVMNPQSGKNSWDVLDERLQAAGVTAAQVQVAWLKQALIGPGRIGAFPVHARKLQAENARIVQMLRERFPNLRIVYLSSRIYAGYATTQLNPEPYAYESAFAVRWQIQEQMAAGAEPQRPVLLWGPYLWADGETPRKSDGLTYARDDLALDGTHPSNSGRQKVAELLLRFFRTDETARGWFVGQ